MGGALKEFSQKESGEREAGRDRSWLARVHTASRVTSCRDRCTMESPKLDSWKNHLLSFENTLFKISGLPSLMLWLNSQRMPHPRCSHYLGPSSWEDPRGRQDNH